MGGKSNYENGMFKQLQEIMDRLDSVEKEHKQEIRHLNGEISDLEKENKLLYSENQLLREDNARLRSIINNDSSNSSLPPSTDQKGTKPANTFNDRNKTERRVGGQKGHKETTLTKGDIEKRIQEGKCRHEIQIVGNPVYGKYVVDLKAETVITEVRI